MANRTVTNNPGNKGSQPSTSSTERDSGSMAEQGEGNPVPAGHPLGGATKDTADQGKAPAPTDDDRRSDRS